MVIATLTYQVTMDLAPRRAAAHEHRGLTQEVLAHRIGIHVTQVRRYKAGNSAPTLDVFRNTALGLAVTIDNLAFNPVERGRQGGLALAFEAAQHLTAEGQASVSELVEATLFKHEARRWAS